MSILGTCTQYRNMSMQTAKTYTSPTTWLQHKLHVTRVYTNWSLKLRVISAFFWLAQNKKMIANDTFPIHLENKNTFWDIKAPVWHKSHHARKPIFWIGDMVRIKPACLTTETSYNQGRLIRPGKTPIRLRTNTLLVCIWHQLFIYLFIFLLDLGL